MQCEEIKKELSEYEEVEIEISNLLSGYNLSTKISREKFEDISSITLDKIKRTIKKTLDDPQYSPSDFVINTCLAFIYSSSEIPDFSNEAKFIPCSFLICFNKYSKI